MAPLSISPPEEGGADGAMARTATGGDRVATAAGGLHSWHGRGCHRFRRGRHHRCRRRRGRYHRFHPHRRLCLHHHRRHLPSRRRHRRHPPRRPRFVPRPHSRPRPCRWCHHPRQSRRQPHHSPPRPRRPHHHRCCRRRLLHRRCGHLPRRPRPRRRYLSPPGLPADSPMLIRSGSADVFAASCGPPGRIVPLPCPRAWFTTQSPAFPASPPPVLACFGGRACGLGIGVAF
mmetsp:Transcript_37126/g.84042  ORF Transcript_37126/g.84042 Transcript_37126/m.84042 type:complete len:231 (-) Transcript_37126:208-900(-)